MKIYGPDGGIFEDEQAALFGAFCGSSTLNPGRLRMDEKFPNRGWTEASDDTILDYLSQNDIDFCLACGYLGDVHSDRSSDGYCPACAEEADE